MYLSIALSLDIHEGMFYWYTDSKGGPSLSQVIGLAIVIYAIPNQEDCWGDSKTLEIVEQQYDSANLEYGRRKEVAK